MANEEENAVRYTKGKHMRTEDLVLPLLPMLAGGIAFAIVAMAATH